VGGGVCGPSALIWGRSVWSPHGLGVRREDESAVGAGRRNRSQAMCCPMLPGLLKRADEPKVAWLIEMG
jgi:hypothetical protein